MAFDKYGYINAYIKEKYDRITLIMPKGRKEVLKQAAQAAGMSASEFLLFLLDMEKERQAVTRSADADKYALLEKWQVPRRYYDMIDKITVTTDERRQQAAAAGQRVACCEYAIYLKAGFINDLTGAQIITTKTKEIRRIMPHTHAV